MQLTWSRPAMGSIMHAAWAVQRNEPLTRRELRAALHPAVQAIDAALCAGGPSPANAWQALVSEACRMDSATALAAQAARFGGSEEAWTRHCDELVGAYRKALPGAFDEMSLRLRPMREQWEARGPGLCRWLASTIGAAFPERATVYALYPVLGGFGQPLWKQPAVRIEALLANAEPALPEVLRLAWLLTRLACGDQPEHGDTATPTRLAQGLVLPVLAAGEFVELTRLDAATIAMALRCWRLADAEQADEQARALLAWYCSSEDPGQAISALRDASAARL